MPDAARLAARALTGSALEAGARLWREGDERASAQTLSEGRETLRVLAQRYDLPELQREQEALERWSGSLAGAQRGFYPFLFHQPAPPTSVLRGSVSPSIARSVAPAATLMWTLLPAGNR